MKDSTLKLLISTVCPLCLLLLTTTAFGQETSGSAQAETGTVASSSKTASDLVTPTTPAPSQPALSLLTKRPESKRPTRSPQGSNSEDRWQFEIRPYVWLAGIYGDLRLNNLTVNVGQDASSLLGMLDFAAAVQVEAIKGKWRIMIDEDYVNLGTTETGPLGNVSIRVEPAQNIFEAGASYTAVSVMNKNATSTQPLSPVFTAEILGGVRSFREKLELQPTNLAPLQGSRHLIRAFCG